MAGITPVSALYEYCAKKKIPSPKYEFIKQTEESTKSYACQVTALNTSVIGVGRSKQEAKHEATYKLIKEVARDYPDISNIPVSHQQVPITDTILQLRNICLQNEYPLPTFNVEQTVGPAHSPQFTVKAQCMSIVRYGSGTSITQAKQLASQNVINVLQNIEADQNVQIDTIENSILDRQQNLRNKFQSYRDLTEEDIQSVSEGTTLANRHLFFTKYNAKTKLEADRILKSENYLNSKERVTDLLETLGIKTRSKYEEFGNQQLCVIELLTTTIDVVFINSDDEIYDEMVDYFKDMLQ